MLADACSGLAHKLTIFGAEINAMSGVASGIRRIEAVAGPAVLAYLNERDVVVKQLSERFKVQPAEITARVAGLQEELKLATKALAAARSELAVAKAAALATANSCLLYTSPSPRDKRQSRMPSSA